MLINRNISHSMGLGSPGGIHQHIWCVMKFNFLVKGTFSHGIWGKLFTEAPFIRTFRGSTLKT
jgi:hypothetical protein